MVIVSVVFVGIVVVFVVLVVVSVVLVVMSVGIVVGVVGVVGGSPVVVVVVCVPSNLPSMYSCALTPKSKFRTSRSARCAFPNSR